MPSRPGSAHPWARVAGSPARHGADRGPDPETGGYARSVPGSDPVPEADRLEQDMPPARDEVERRPVPPDTPEADAIEQAMPRGVTDAEPSGMDAERIEPVDEDWETSSGS